jgi:hypothetical protein
MFKVYWLRYSELWQLKIPFHSHIFADGSLCPLYDSLSCGRFVWWRLQWNVLQIRCTSQISSLKSCEVIIGWLVSRQSCLAMSRSCSMTVQTRRHTYVTTNIPITDLSNSFVWRATKKQAVTKSEKGRETVCRVYRVIKKCAEYTGWSKSVQNIQGDQKVSVHLSFLPHYLA